MATENIYYYETVLAAIEELGTRGFNLDFNLRKEDIRKNPENYQIVHIFRYEGESDPGDEATVYGIVSNLGAKGIFVQGFSAGSMDDDAEILKKVNIKGRDLL
ncbi:MAG TPA: hypothetical protein VK476_05760 [Flavobacterium sp.]|nr:hypothetical protein [Flavobacterium sp.]